MRPRTCWKNKQQLRSIQSKSVDVCGRELVGKTNSSYVAFSQKTGDVCGREIVGKTNSSYVV